MFEEADEDDEGEEYIRCQHIVLYTFWSAGPIHLGLFTLTY
jgi:hypothetical protein